MVLDVRVSFFPPATYNNSIVDLHDDRFMRSKRAAIHQTHVITRKQNLCRHHFPSYHLYHHFVFPATIRISAFRRTHTAACWATRQNTSPSPRQLVHRKSVQQQQLFFFYPHPARTVIYYTQHWARTWKHTCTSSERPVLMFSFHPLPTPLDRLQETRFLHDSFN